MTNRRSTVPAHARRLVVFGYCALSAFVIWYWFNSATREATLTLVTIGLFVCGIHPILQWVRRGDTSYPLVEVLLLTTIPFYAVPILTERDVISAYSHEVTLGATTAVLVYEIAVMVGGWIARKTYRPPKRGQFWSDEIIPESNLRFASYTTSLTTVYLFASAFLDLLPHDWVGTFRAVFIGIGTISLFIQARLWGSGKLPVGDKILLIANLLAQLAFLFVSLLLVNGIIFLSVALIGYFSTSRKIPWAVCMIVVPLLGVLHNGKARMRLMYWREDAPQVHVTDLPAFFSTWVQFGLQANTQDNETVSATDATYGLMRRASLFQIVCVAVDTTPYRRPFLYGDSYRNIAAQFIPRAVWPDKPKPADSVKLLSVQLGLLTREQAEMTSIGFGMVSEAYANFGYAGELGLGLILGILLGVVAVSTADAPTFSIGGVLRVLFLAWCLNAESPLVVWISSLYQACIAVSAPLIAYRALM